MFSRLCGIFSLNFDRCPYRNQTSKFLLFWDRICTVKWNPSISFSNFIDCLPRLFSVMSDTSIFFSFSAEPEILKDKDSTTNCPRFVLGKFGIESPRQREYYSGHSFLIGHVSQIKPLWGLKLVPCTSA